MLRLSFALALAATALPAVAQVAPRLSGEAIITQLQAGADGLSSRATATQDPQLEASAHRLAQMAADLRQSLGAEAARPVELLGDSEKAKALRGSAAASRTQAYLDTIEGCLAGDAAAMASALASSLAQLAAAPSSSRSGQAVIDGVETLEDHRPVFVVRGGSKDVALALVGQNLFDAQCESPRLTATDAKGKPLAVQPAITGLQPNRIEFKWADTAGLAPGPYVLHVAGKRKAFLVGCTAQPAVATALQVAAPVRLDVDYTVVATCDAGPMPAVSGRFEAVGTKGGTAAAHIDVSGCSNPSGYAITATVKGSQGAMGSVGPLVQGPSAAITAGLPGGLALSWDPSVQQLFVRAAGKTCKGVY